MQQRTILWVITGGLMGLVGFSTVLDIDLVLSARYYDATRGWFLQDAAPWRWLYRYGVSPALLLAAGALVVGLGSWYRPAWARHRRTCLALVLAVALGPGLLTNALLKPYWGRPRPRHIEAFGGTHAYRQWWQPGGPGAGKSFPSGHASMGYILLAGVVLVPWRGRPAWQIACGGGAFLYGTLMGYTRIVQGGHFASDVLWSGCLMACTVGMLHPLVRSRN